MRVSIAVSVFVAGLLFARESPCLSIVAPDAWQPIVARADFVGVVRCLDDSYTKMVFDKSDSTFKLIVLASGVVESAVKGSTSGQRLLFHLGPARIPDNMKMYIGVRTAKRDERYFVIARCSGSDYKIPDTLADYYVGSSLSWMQWTEPKYFSSQKISFGSKHSSLDAFLADAQTFVSLPPAERELVSLQEDVRPLLINMEKRLGDGLCTRVVEATDLAEFWIALAAVLEWYRDDPDNFAQVAREHINRILPESAGAESARVLCNLALGADHPLTGLSQAIEAGVKRREACCSAIGTR